MTFHRKESVRSDDFYPTPPWATRALLEQLAIITGLPVSGQNIWEPACGTGDMAKPLLDAGNAVYATDLVDRGYADHHESGIDFLIPHPMEVIRWDWIITNPPYKLAEQFCHRALTICPREGVAMFNRLTFVEGKNRHERLFSVAPPSHILIFTERVNLNKGVCSSSVSTPVGSAWYVWLTGYTGPTNLLWIPVPGPTRTRQRLPAGDCTMKPELLPCQHCGGEAVLTKTHYSQLAKTYPALMQVKCSICPITTTDRHGLPEKEAIAAWNRRHDPVKDQLVAALEKAENILLNTPWGCARAEDLTECHTVINKALAKAKGGAQ